MGANMSISLSVHTESDHVSIREDLINFRPPIHQVLSPVDQISHRSWCSSPIDLMIFCRDYHYDNEQAYWHFLLLIYLKTYNEHKHL